MASVHNDTHPSDPTVNDRKENTTVTGYDPNPRTNPYMPTQPHQMYAPNPYQEPYPTAGDPDDVYDDYDEYDDYDTPPRHDRSLHVPNPYIDDPDETTARTSNRRRRREGEPTARAPARPLLVVALVAAIALMAVLALSLLGDKEPQTVHALAMSTTPEPTPTTTTPAPTTTTAAPTTRPQRGPLTIAPGAVDNGVVSVKRLYGWERAAESTEQRLIVAPTDDSGSRILITARPVEAGVTMDTLRDRVQTMIAARDQFRDYNPESTWREGSMTYHEFPEGGSQVLWTTLLHSGWHISIGCQWRGELTTVRSFACETAVKSVQVIATVDRDSHATDPRQNSSEKPGTGVTIGTTKTPDDDAAL